MKKNNILILLLLGFVIAGCSNKGLEDPLILPPNFEEMPDINNKNQNNEKPKDQDIEKLRELLLKKQ